MPLKLSAMNDPLAAPSDVSQPHFPRCQALTSTYVYLPSVGISVTNKHFGFSQQVQRLDTHRPDC